MRCLLSDFSVKDASSADDPIRLAVVEQPQEPQQQQQQQQQQQPSSRSTKDASVSHDTQETTNTDEESNLTTKDLDSQTDPAQNFALGAEPVVAKASDTGNSGIGDTENVFTQQVLFIGR